MSNSDLGQHFDFDQTDADAVCELCSTVNPDGTLICKSCGNNLRDQRARRIALEQGGPLDGPPINRVRVFTGVLTMLGIVTILAAVVNMGSIENMLVARQLRGESGSLGGLWSGPEAAIYNDLLFEMQTNPSSSSRRLKAMQDPVIDTSYNGRYALWGEEGFQRRVDVGEANLSRRGNKIHFVAILNSGIEIRGYATMIIEEGGNSRPIAMRSAGVRLAGAEFLAWGYAERNEDGSHSCYGQSSRDDGKYGVLAYRIR